MKTKNMFICCVFVVAVISGCSKPLEQPETMSDMQVVTTYNPQAAFPKSAAYTFLRERPEQEDLPEDAQVIVRRLRDAIKDQLKDKKYKSAKDQIDYIVDYEIVAEYSIGVLAERSEIQGEEWITVIGVPSDFIKGALVIDVIDAVKLKPVWRGVCNANIALAEVSEDEKDRRAQYAVQELLKTFPPK